MTTEQEARYVIEAAFGPAMRSAVRRRFSPGEALFRTFDRAHSLLLLVSGHVAASITSERGETTLLGVHAAGETLGSRALLHPTRTHQWTARAIDRVTALNIAETAFDTAVTRDPSLAKALAVLAVVDATRFATRLSDAHSLRADERVRRGLADLTEGFTVGRSASLALTHELLASYSLVTRPTVTRVLGEGQAAGVLQCGRGRIDVPDVERLKRWSVNPSGRSRAA